MSVIRCTTRPVSIQCYCEIVRTFYELQDHLGNVRAVIGDNFDVDYLATMEDARVTATEESDFSGITPVAASSWINHTPASTETPSPNKVIRINNGATQQPIGGGIMLWVHPGDKIDASVQAKYQNFNSSNTTAVTGIAGYLSTMFGGTTTIIDGVSVFNGIDAPAGGVCSS